jgi:hypothetical protein
MRKSRVLGDEDDYDDEPLVIGVSSDSGSSSDNEEEEGFRSESGDEQIMWFNPLFFEFQKLHWLSASSEAAKQFAARKHARIIKRQKCRENAERKRARGQLLDGNLPKIHTRKRVSHHSKSGQRDDQLARSEGEISTVEEVDENEIGNSQNTKNACILIEKMWKNVTPDHENIFEPFECVTVDAENFEKYGAIIASNLSFSTSMQTGYTMITTSTRRSDQTRILGCSVFDCFTQPEGKCHCPGNSYIGGF